MLEYLGTYCVLSTIHLVARDVSNAYCSTELPLDVTLTHMARLVLTYSSSMGFESQTYINGQSLRSCAD